MGVQDFNDWFCIPAFFVLFRETLEAAVLVAVLIQYLNRANAKHLKRQVWLGAAVGGAASVAIGVVILSIYYTQKSTMTTTTAFIVEGGMLGFACVVITYFLVTHLAPGMKSSGSWQVKWERNMDELVQAQIDKTNEYGFFTLSFTSVLREGFEAAIFVVGFGAAYKPESMPIPIVTGIFAGVAFGASMFVGTNKMDLSFFFKFSAGFLALIAAGLGSHASYEFQKGEAFGAWGCKRICDDVWVPAVLAPFGTYASYAPYTDIAPHAAIDLDMRAFSDRMQAEDWDGAWEIYDQGGNSVKGDGFRTLRGFSKDLSGEPTYDEFLAYHGNAKYADDYVRAVMWDRLSDDSTAKLDPRPELFATNTLTWDMAFQMALKAAQYQSTWMYSLHELYSALGKCEAGDVGPEGAPHAWDEGWAFYVGSIPGETGSPFGSLSYALPDKRCNAWNYCADDAGRPGWREAGDGANSDVNARMLRLYRAGLAAVRDETRCAEARTYVDKILVQMTFPLMQGAMRYAYRADPQGEGTALGTASLGHGKTWAELHAFTMAVLPRVASCAPEAAAVLERNLVLPDVLDASTHDQLVPDGYVAVKEAFQASYACLGITCADVGSLDAIPGLEACDDGSTLDDEVAYYDGLELLAGSGYSRIGGYKPATDVTPHAAIDLDVLDFEAALEAGEWDAAWAVYADGAHSAKGDGLRTLRGFSKDLSGEKTFDEYMAYHQNAKYADDYVRAALWDRLSDDSSAKADPRPALFATATLSDAMAVELALKGAQYQHTWIYSTHELYSALGKCEAGDVDEAAPHAWDEGWAFYAGSTTGADGAERGALGYGLGERRCVNFGTCADDGLASWRSEDEGANANANAKLLRLYEAGLKDIQDADRCGDARAYVDDIVAQMTVPLVQGTLRYAYRSSPEGTAEALGSDGKVWAEFHAFGYALLPRVHACDASAGAALAAALEAPDVIDESTAGDLVPGGFAAVKAALESTYACLGITCADVGGLQASEGWAIEGMGACADGSSVDDGAAYFDALEEIGARPDGDWEEANCDDDEADASWHSYRRLEAEPWYDALVEQVPEAYGRKLVTERAKSCDGKGQSIAWPNEEVWDITGCCDTKNGFFFLMMVLFWYRPAITNLELIIWVIYWPIIAFWGWYKVRDITDFNADLQAAADAKGPEELKPEGRAEAE